MIREMSRCYAAICQMSSTDAPLRVRLFIVADANHAIRDYAAFFASSFHTVFCLMLNRRNIAVELRCLLMLRHDGETRNR